MYRQGVGDFKYYVGISSLAQIATRQDRVCVLNILGGESSDVTPVGHEYSGGNVVFGTSPGRGGQVLETKIGDLEVGIREGTAAWLDVHSRFGQLHNSLEAADTPEKAAATVDVRARTSVGEIVIRRP